MPKSSSRVGSSASVCNSSSERARPSTKPARNLKAGLSLAYLAKLFASAATSPAVYAMELTPCNPFSNSAAGVSWAARSARVFLITRYFPPTFSTLRRSSVSCFTVNPWKVERTRLDTCSNSWCRLSICSCFWLRFFATRASPQITASTLAGSTRIPGPMVELSVIFLM